MDEVTKTAERMSEMAAGVISSETLEELVNFSLENMSEGSKMMKEMGITGLENMDEVKKAELCKTIARKFLEAYRKSK